MAPKLAYLGLGNMGQAMCKNLVQKGNLSSPLVLYNRTAKRANELSDRVGNCIVSSSITNAVADADIIFSCLTDDNAVLETFTEILKHDVKGKLFVSCSTTQPETSDKLASLVEAQDAGLVTMPVFGEPSMAEKGLLTCVPAGRADLVVKVLPYCTGVIGRAVIDFSDQPHSKASLLKVIGNVFIINMIETVAEGLVLAEKAELGKENLHKFIEVIFPGPHALYSKRMITGDYYTRDEPAVAIDMARHLAEEVSGLASASGAKLPAYEVARKHLDMVKDYAGAKGDVSGIYGALRLLGGLAFENQN
ncbi:MAG: hypothetical protein HETSPECPRED_008360 [Heterodermia speciosa]|uniref:6-phosphogluconate dehydrogenase NADP-binding domain-containing protein n=1 Tax=Heterodermia speciosa TaxID=116794 RepID=A0A8H3ILH8_9LECA|nr:MAG: hypothetical protein HETSPECPRED_008360 [Heterodermia speciosa]